MTAKARRITPALLRGWPLPMPDGEGDKTTRGRLLMVAGSRELPGAAILTANAALRSGVGKLCVATEASIAAGVAIAVPEARVVALGDRKRDVAVDPEDFDALLAGPGISERDARGNAHMRKLASSMSPVVVDAGGLELLDNRARAARRSATEWIATPHLGEMAHLLLRDKDDVEAHAAEIAVAFAAERGVVVALKGARTYVADPDGSLWVQDQTNVGLAISGSGDVLAGIIAALAARGASSAQATVWGVALHAHAGARLVARHGRLGGLARELPDCIPAGLRAFGSR